MIYLYRHFNKKNVLLYVGVTAFLSERLSSHRNNSIWFEEIATVKIDRFKTKQDALVAEAMAIKRENPKYNLSFEMNRRSSNKKSRGRLSELLENRKRDRRIVRMVAQGTKQAEVARKLGMHRQQVSLIVKRSKPNAQEEK